MRNDDIRRIFSSLETFRSQLEPFSRAMKDIAQSQILNEVTQGLNRHQELVRAAFGPFEELRRAGYLDLQLDGEILQLGNIMEVMVGRFRLPEVSEAMRLLHESINRKWTIELQNAMEAMSAPWLDIANEVRSINGFAGLQGIGAALRTMPAFDSKLVDSLRLDLGDWSEEVTWPTGIFADPPSRTAFYAERGLNLDLTAFPNNAFEQIISNVGLEGTHVAMADGYYSELELEEKEDAFERTNRAHDLLQRFESQVRRFIDERMKAAFGTEWIKHQVPGEMRKQWLDKQRQAKDEREQRWPLIAYADFSDYVRIITRSDNWQQVFEEVFISKTSVQESFQRLYPIRVCTMHARLITQDDELYLRVEMKRILEVIGIMG